VRFPNRYFINKEAWSRFLGTWHAFIGSQTLSRRSSARYRKGREIRLNGICGVIFEKAESRNSIRLFSLSNLCHPERKKVDSRNPAAKGNLTGPRRGSFKTARRDFSTSFHSAQDDDDSAPKNC